MTPATRAAIDAAKLGVLAHLASRSARIIGRSKGHLMRALCLTDAGRVDGLPHSRVLDRALQELRRAGKIRYDHRQWWLVEPIHLTCGGSLAETWLWCGGDHAAVEDPQPADMPPNVVLLDDGSEATHLLELATCQDCLARAADAFASKGPTK